MKRILSLVGLVLVAVLAMAAATRPNGEFPLMLRLNGSPVRIGVITSAGASTTNASTGTPFTIPTGDVEMVVCDAAAFCVEAASVSGTYTAATMGVPMALGVPRIFTMKPPLTTGGVQTTTFACFGAAAFNCAFFTMQ